MAHTYLVTCVDRSREGLDCREVDARRLGNLTRFNREPTKVHSITESPSDRDWGEHADDPCSEMVKKEPNDGKTDDP